MNAAGTRKNRHGRSIRVFPTDGGMGHRVTTGIHHRTEVKRNLEASYRAQWTKEMKIQLEQDQARMIAIVQELNAAEVKAQPDIERRKDNIDGKTHRSLKDRAIAAQGMLNAIDDGDMTRLQRSQRARDAVGSGDPDQILATVLAHLTAISGQETRGDVVYHLKELTQTRSAENGDGIFEHLNILRDVAEVSCVLLGSLPGEPSQEKKEFQDKYNEELIIALAIMSLDEKTQLLRRRWEGTVNPQTLAAYTFDQYVYGLTTFIQNEPQVAAAAEPRVAKVMSAAQIQRTSARGAGAGAGDGAGADRPRLSLRCFRCKKRGHKIADCTADSDEDDDALTTDDLKAIKSFLRSAAVASLAESKTSKVAVAPKATGLVARTSYPLPFISDDDEGEDDA